jgi:hypothetical protein
MKLKYLHYMVRAEESILLGMLGSEHPVIKDPESLHHSGWDKMTEFYLNKQSVLICVYAHSSNNSYFWCQHFHGKVLHANICASVNMYLLIY